MAIEEIALKHKNIAFEVTKVLITGDVITVRNESFHNFKVSFETTDECFGEFTLDSAEASLEGVEALIHFRGLGVTVRSLWGFEWFAFLAWLVGFARHLDYRVFNFAKVSLQSKYLGELP